MCLIFLLTGFFKYDNHACNVSCSMDVTGAGQVGLVFTSGLVHADCYRFTEVTA